MKFLNSFRDKITNVVFIIRQLTMLSAALRGRVHLESPVFRSRNHLSLFTQVLGLLELLKPHLFRAEYTNPLHSIFDTYFALFKVCMNLFYLILNYCFIFNSKFLVAISLLIQSCYLDK